MGERGASATKPSADLLHFVSRRRADRLKIPVISSENSENHRGGALCTDEVIRRSEKVDRISELSSNRHVAACVGAGLDLWRGFVNNSASDG